MLGKKHFSPKLFGANDAIGKQAGIYHLLNHGAKWVGINPDRYGCDLVYRTNLDMDSPPQLLEVEVKHTWDGGRFPYDTVNVLYRKAKYFEEGADLLLLSGNLTDYLIIKGPDALALEPVEVQNIYVGQLEFFYQVPLEQVDFYKFSRALRNRSMSCTCGNQSYYINRFALVCDVCGKTLK
jgi:hypothetical protein